MVDQHPSRRSGDRDWFERLAPSRLAFAGAGRIFFEQLRLKPASRLPGIKESIGDALLKVHVSYGPLVQRLLKKFNNGSVRSRSIKGLAHITGGGFVDNIPRVLPANCDVRIRKGSWDELPIFKIIREQGKVPEPELGNSGFQHGHWHGSHRRSQSSRSKVLQAVKRRKHKAWIIGEVIKGRGVVHVNS